MGKIGVDDQIVTENLKKEKRWNSKGNSCMLGVKLTAHEGEMMPEGALTSLILCDANRSIVPLASCTVHVIGVTN